MVSSSGESDTSFYSRNIYIYTVGILSAPRRRVSLLLFQTDVEQRSLFQEPPHGSTRTLYTPCTRDIRSSLPPRLAFPTILLIQSIISIRTCLPSDLSNSQWRVARHHSSSQSDTAFYTVTEGLRSSSTRRFPVLPSNHIDHPQSFSRVRCVMDSN